MEEAWRDIKVLLVPSLWFEAWGIVLVEAHLRGIPVISSDAGALPEAMLGLNYIVPVNPIKGNRNDKGTYIVPDQDIEPWVDIVNKLMRNKSEYEEISMKVRDTTSHWLKNMDELALENWLHRSAVKSGMRERADSATMIASV
jgi:glycosyltransferase involved in cell wall biosynthesis